MTWTMLVNLFFFFFSGYIAIGCWKEGRNLCGHLNAFASVLNGVIFATKLGL